MSVATEVAWSALAEESRRRLLDELLARGGASASALALVVPISRQAIAKHLAVLAEAGLLEAAREGRELRYSVRAEELTSAAEGIVASLDQWRRRLRALKSVAEEAHRASGAGSA